MQVFMQIMPSEAGKSGNPPQSTDSGDTDGGNEFSELIGDLVDISVGSDDPTSPPDVSVPQPAANPQIDASETLNAEPLADVAMNALPVSLADTQSQPKPSADLTDGLGRADQVLLNAPVTKLLAGAENKTQTEPMSAVEPQKNMAVQDNTAMPLKLSQEITADGKAVETVSPVGSQPKTAMAQGNDFPTPMPASKLEAEQTARLTPANTTLAVAPNEKTESRIDTKETDASARDPKQIVIESEEAISKTALPSGDRIARSDNRAEILPQPVVSENASKKTQSSDRTLPEFATPQRAVATVAVSPTHQAYAQPIAAPVIMPMQQKLSADSVFVSDQSALPDSPAMLGAVEGEELTPRTGPDRPRFDLAPRPIISQVVHSITRSNLDGFVEIRLQPEELGRVRLTMAPSELGVAVQISAERPETLELMRRNIDILAAELSERGFADLDFSFGQGSDFSDSTDSRSNGQFGEKGGDDPASLKVEIADGPSGLTTGRVDLRV